MTTQSLGHNAIEFRSGMHKSCSGYADTALVFRVRDVVQQQAASSVDHSLAPRQLLVLPDENLIVTCVAGELWLTRYDDFEDYILVPGQSFTVRRGDQAAVQALKPSRVRMVAA